MKDAAIAQIQSLTGVSQVDAINLLEKYNYRVDVAADAFFDEQGVAETLHAPSTEVIEALFEKYTDGIDDEIGVDGTINFLGDLKLELEEPVVLALAYEFKSPAVGRWPRSGWVEGMKGLQCETLESLRGAVEMLREKLGSKRDYFYQVYSYTFGFGLSEGQRSLPVESAIQFWTILLPFGLQHGVLGSQDAFGWNEPHTELWFSFLRAQNVKGVSKDTWGMFLDFINSSDGKFERHDTEGSWPSLIDEFVVYAKEQSGKV
ncbi:hypothetical protein M407DRAFT_153108 [Tulasnella calospora MUT 4182]|uniref:Defective in cullin neddylation protein n=1 Tax=Tulasnella calospora MUT 4182 TaxID=1051891 RepID=A0A0C3LBY9_9AGAM|nr:hypothetical protein M407DRAFT_153108 [Tulasnella calospora MUT 4182]